MDQQQDLGYQVLFSLSRQGEWPAYVKQAVASDTMQPQQLPDRAYADPRKRRFPCHTKAATYLSWLYFLEHSDQLPAKEASAVRQRLIEFSQFWEMVPDIQQLLTKTAAWWRGNGEREPDDHFGLVEQNGTVRSYPLRNRTEVQTAARWFCKHARALQQDWPYPRRASLADRILHRAEALGESLESARIPLERSAGLGIAEPQQLAEQVRWRSYAPNAPKEALRKLANEITPDLAIDRPRLLKLAEMLDAVDKTCGLRYGQQLMAPEEACFNIARSELEETRRTTWSLPTGSTWPAELLSKVSGADLRTLLGPSAPTELMPDPDVCREALEQLPVKSAQRLERWLVAQGYKPLREAPPPAPMTREDWAIWAQLA